ncbi:MAG: flagellar hook-length control protein FliK [Desulfohalobiaceae bacterium]
MQIFPALIQQQGQGGLGARLSGSGQADSDFSAWLQELQEAQGQGQELGSEQMQELLSRLGLGSQAGKKLLQNGFQELSLEQQHSLLAKLGLEGQGFAQGQSVDDELLQALGLDSKQAQELLSQLQEDSQARQRLLQALEGEEDLAQRLADKQELLQALGLDSKQAQELLSQLQEDSQARQRLLQALQNEQNAGQELALVQDMLQEMQQEGLNLTDQDLGRLQDLLSKLGLEGQQLQDALAALEQGDSSSFMRLVQQGVQDLPQDKGLQLEKGEVFALGKALGLDKKQSQELASKMAASREMEARELKQVLDSMRQEQAREAEKGLQKLLDKLQAWKAELKEGQQDTEQNRQANRLLQDLERIARNVLQAREQAGAMAKSATDGKAAGSQGSGEEGPWISGLRQKVQERAEAEQRQGSRAEEGQKGGQEQRLQAQGGESSQNRDFSGFKEGQDKDWSQLWDRLQQNGSKQENSSSDWRLALQGQDRSQAQQGAKAEAETQKSDILKDSKLRQEVLRQIQDGAFRNLGQGRQELSLRLHPPELGRVDVVLSLQGKEVSALLKTSSQDVGQMLQQQLSSLQQQLEQQGLKVQRLDVQTQVAQDGSAQQWMGQKGHNQAQENQQKQKQWSLRRRLDLLEREQAEDTDPVAAQELARARQGQSLYLIA